MSSAETAASEADAAPWHAMPADEIERRLGAVGARFETCDDETLIRSRTWHPVGGPRVLTKRCRRGRPLADAVQRQNDCFSKGRGEKGARSVTLMMLGEEPLKFKKWLFVKDYIIELIDAGSSFLKTVSYRPAGKSCVILLAGEALLLGRGDNSPVLEQHRRAVVIEGRDSKYPHRVLQQDAEEGSQ